MKKGATEQTFIFIFALIVAAMIMAWGTKTIIDLKGKAGQVQLADSIEDIKEKAITYYNLEAESSAPLAIRFPTNVKCICFKDLLTNRPVGNPASNDYKPCTDDPLFDPWMRSDSNNNILVMPTKDFVVAKFKTIKEFIPIENDENPLCFNLESNKGIFRATIESRGDMVIIYS